MAAPEWTKDEKSLEDAKEYLRTGNTVDFFEQVAAAVLREHPSDLPKFCLELVDDMAAGKPMKGDGEFQPKKEEDNKYMRANKVSDFLDKWVLELLAKRPADDAGRIQFHQQFLKDLQKAGESSA